MNKDIMGEVTKDKYGEIMPVILVEILEINPSQNEGLLRYKCR